MREIRFRAWDTENKEMLEVENLQWVFGSEDIAVQVTNHLDNFSTEEMILMQFTGLYDKNKVPIYERRYSKKRNTFRKFIV